MFTVLLRIDCPDSEFQEIPLFKCEKDVEAINFALSLHQVSNCPHCISVMKTFDPVVDGISDVEICTLLSD